MKYFYGAIINKKGNFKDAQNSWKLHFWSSGVMCSFFRCVLRVTGCESCTGEFSLQNFNPEPGPRNSKHVYFSMPTLASTPFWK